MKLFILTCIIMLPYNCVLGHYSDNLNHPSMRHLMLQKRYEEEKHKIRTMLKTIITQKRVSIENAFKLYNSTLNSKATNLLRGTPAFKSNDKYKPFDSKYKRKDQNYYFQNNEILKANKGDSLTTKELATLCNDRYHSDAKFCKDIKKSESMNYGYNILSKNNSKGSKINTKDYKADLKSITYYSSILPFLQEQFKSKNELIASRHNKASDEMSNESLSSKINYIENNPVQPGQHTQQISKEISSNMQIDSELALVLGLSQSTLADKVIHAAYLNETNNHLFDHGFPTEQPKPMPVQVFEQLFSEDEMQNNQVVQDMHDRLENKIDVFNTVSKTSQGNSIVYLILPVAILALLAGVMSGAVPPLLMGLLGLAIPATIFVTLVNVGNSAARRNLEHDSILDYAKLNLPPSLIH